MTTLSHVVQDERTARMVLSMIVEPDDAVTGRLLRELGALALYRLPEAVVFELQVSGGFLCRLHRARLRGCGVLRVFKLHRQRRGTAESGDATQANRV